MSASWRRSCGRICESACRTTWCRSVGCGWTQLPLTVSRKIDHERLPEPTSERDLEWDGEATAAEELVGGIWCEVLQLEAVGRDENFFDLGGHSLLATQVISRVRQVFGIEVGLRRLFEEPTVRGLSRSIEELLREGGGTAVPALQRAEDARPVADVVCSAAFVVPRSNRAGWCVLQHAAGGAVARRLEHCRAGADAE